MEHIFVSKVDYFLTFNKFSEVERSGGTLDKTLLIELPHFHHVDIWSTTFTACVWRTIKPPYMLFSPAETCKASGSECLGPKFWIHHSTTWQTKLLGTTDTSLLGKRTLHVFHLFYNISK